MIGFHFSKDLAHSQHFLSQVEAKLSDFSHRGLVCSLAAAFHGCFRTKTMWMVYSEHIQNIYEYGTLRMGRFGCQNVKMIVLKLFKECHDVLTCLLEWGVHLDRIPELIQLILRSGIRWCYHPIWTTQGPDNDTIDATSLESWWEMMVSILVRMCFFPLHAWTKRLWISTFDVLRSQFFVDFYSGSISHVLSKATLENTSSSCMSIMSNDVRYELFIFSQLPGEDL